VVRDPDGAAQELMQNGDFELSPASSKWRTLGNHRHSVVIAEPGNAGNQVLHIVASGGAGIAHNHLESTFVGNTPIQAGQIYEVSFKARWLRGDNRLNVRAFSAKLAGTFALSMPAQAGTPGAANSAAAGNLGPTIAGLRHDPIIPAAGAAVTISADIADPDGLASLVVRTTINGSPGPGAALTPAGVDGHHEATLPGQPAGTVVQFWIEAEDSAGAVSMAPAAGPGSRALYQVDDGVSTSLSASRLRLVMLPAERDFMFGFFNLMSNERLGSTVIVEGTKAHYDTGVRLRGSGAGRVRDGDHYISYNIGFPADDLFRGVHSSIGIDRSGRAPTVRGQDEIYVKHMFNHAGVPCMYDDLTFFISPRSIHNGTALLQLARYGSVFVESQFSGGDRGGVFDLDIPYGPGTTSTPGDSESVKPPMPFDSGSHTGPRWTDFANLGDDKEQYRGPFELRTGTRRDDYSGLIELCQTMDLPTGQLAAEIERVMDVDEWLRYAALNTLCGIRDTYTNPLGGLPLWHNVRVFVPEDGQAVAMPWDGDFVFGAAASSSMLTVNGNFRRILDLPQYTRLYWGHIRDLVTSTFNTAYMDPWLEHYGDVCGQNFTARSSYIAARGAYALTQLPANVGFAVTTNGGFDFAVDDTMATLEGDGWIDIREFRLAGSHDPLEAIWTDGDSWQVQIPLLPGANPITLETYDFQGLLLDSHSLTITSTVTAPTTPEFLRITELHYNPADPSGVELAVSVDNDDYEFVELRNIGPDPLDISGAKFTAGITFTFAPGTILQGGEFILVVSDQAAFEARYGNSLNVAGEYAPTNLANSGETLELRDAPGNIVHQFSYDDDWLPASDGHGYSMGILDQDAASAQWGLREGWGLCGFGGSPGAVDACHGTQFEAWQQTYFTEAEREDLSVSAPGSDPNHDGTDNLSSYAFALDPFSVPGSGKPVAVALVGGRLQITFKRWRFAPDLIYTPQFSSDLKNWAGGMTQVGGPLDHGDGTESVTFEVPGESHTTIFVRVVLELTSLP
ncbi:MAG: CotH kinase family protein, partial [Vicinamibacterales bacterium]|nr:CotH kinase family protein [Vicinamibacterales bacterium]